jgi:transposase
VTLGTASAAAPRGPSKPNAERVAWESLIAFRETEESIVPAKPKPAPKAKHLPEPAPAEGPVRRPSWRSWPMVAAASVLGALLLGVIIYVTTDNGRIKVVVSGARPTVMIDGETVRIEGLDKPITLRAGPHELAVRWGDGEFKTSTFVVRRGDNEELRVEYEPKPSPAKPSVPPAAESISRTITDSNLVIKSYNIAIMDNAKLNFPSQVDRNIKATLRDDRIYINEAFGRKNVLCTGPLSPSSPGTVDFSRITSDRTGTLALLVHGYPGPMPGGRIVVKSDGVMTNDVTVNFGDGWKKIVVPVRRNKIVVEHHALGWNMEFLFIDYEVVPDTTPETSAGGTSGPTSDLKDAGSPTVDKPKAPPTDHVDASDFTRLFNGKDLSGWAFPLGNDTDWTVENGSLRGSATSGGTTIATSRSNYKDYHLRMEIRTTDNLYKHLLVRASHSDGDVKYYEFVTGVLKGGGEIAYLGEYRFKRGGPWDDGSQVTTDGLREITAPKLPGLAKDTWQRVEIIAVGNEFRMRVDDREVSAFQDTESRLKQGQVAFRLSIGCYVEIRNIEIKELNGKGVAGSRPSPSDIAGPRPTPVDRGTTLPTSTPPPVTDGTSNNHPTVDLEKKDGKADLARPGANERAQIRAIDAALALNGKAEILSGQWLVEGRELVQTGAGIFSVGKLLFGDLRWTDYDFTVELMREKGNGFTGLSFHRTLRNGNTIGFNIGVDTGICELSALEDGEENVLGKVEFHVVDRTWYRARVSVRRNHIVCTLHDDQSNEPVHLEAHYNRLPRGQVGLGTFESSYRFRNIKVTAPDGKILWEMPPAIGESPAGKELSGTPVGDRTPPVTRGGPEEHKYGKTDPVRPRANERARAQAIDAAIALKGKAEILSGRWLVEGRELLQTDATRDRVRRMLFGDPHWTDYDFTVDLMREKGNDAAALGFRRSPRNDKFLAFGLSGESWGIWACGGGEETELKEAPFRLIDRKWYRARVSVRRNHIVCTLHDDMGNELVNLAADDDLHPRGQVQLATESSSYRFKNIKVTDPDGKTLWEMPPAIGESPPGPKRGRR